MSSNASPGKLFLVATPIGNLEDLSPRAIKTIESSDLVACEDTRISRRILDKYSISKPLISYREENEKSQSEILAEKISQGLNIALLSDAGLPTISDPGFRLVRECHLQDLKVIPIPGPNAAMSALCASGLPTHQFIFLGFLPSKKAAAGNMLKKWIDFTGSVVLYESKYKMNRTLNLFENLLEPERYICIARELTKIHENIISGPLPEVIKKFHSGSAKGEFTLIIAPKGYSF